MKILERLALVVVLAGSTVGALWADGKKGSEVRKANLDLPFEFVGVEEEEEDSAEIVHLFGQLFEGEGFVFVGGGSF